MNDNAKQLTALCAAVLPIWMRQLATSRAQSEAAVHDMLAAFAGMRPLLDQALGDAETSAPTPADAQAFSAHVEQMYRGFQYQDRVSQMVALLHEDMGRLLDAVNAADSDPVDLDPTAWLARLESAYAMAEQRKDHGKSSPDGSSAGPDSEVSFF